jgi:UDP-N-acetyl-D-mannosaminuronic acid transferase (WecB/TagA/CpsF family)
LNGTDFIPFFLHQLVEQQQAIHLGIYSVYDPEIGKSQEELEKAIEHIQTTYGLDVARSQQSLYAERGKDVALGEYEKNLTHTDADIHILLVCTGTPHQEMWAHEHRDFFKKHKVLVFNAGGLIDYWS